MERGSGRRLRRLLPVAALGALTGLLPVLGGAATLPSAQAVQRPWWPAAMGFDDLHGAGGTGKGITIAVLDDVIDPKAADIKGRVASTESVCWEKKSTGTGSEADHATEIAQLLVGTGASANGMPGVRGIARVGTRPPACSRSSSRATSRSSTTSTSTATPRPHWSRPGCGRWSTPRR